jgi:hypothetical protein
MKSEAGQVRPPLTPVPYISFAGSIPARLAALSFHKNLSSLQPQQFSLKFL